MNTNNNSGTILNNKIKWDEFNKPIVLSPEDWGKKNYILQTQLEKCFEMIEGFSSIHKSFKNDCEKKIKFEVPMNVGIIGDRGSGKTSLLKSLKLKLESENYFVFDIVDPNTLSSDLNILEILISNMYSIMNKKEDTAYHRDVKDEYLKTKIFRLIKQIMSALARKRQKSDFLKKDNPEIDLVEKINDIVNLDYLIIQLFEHFKSYWSTAIDSEVKDIVLLIDDMDLVENSYVLKLISEIQEYLSTKVIIVIAYKHSQIEESMLEEKIKNNKVLIDASVVEIDSLKKQIEHLLMKLIPIENRINLYSQLEMLNLSYLKIFRSLEIDEEILNENNLSASHSTDKSEEMTVREWIYQKLLEAIRIYIKPVDEKEVDKFFLPGSLREFIQLASLLTSFSYKSSANEYCVEGAIKNIGKFRGYFIEKNYSILGHDEKDLLDSWLLVDPHQKNYLIFHYFLDCFKSNYIFSDELEGKLLKKDFSKDAYPFNLSIAENFNLRLGDVFEIMELYKKHVAETSIDFYLVYFFKVLCSLEMTQLLLESYLSLQEMQNDKSSLQSDLKLDFKMLIEKGKLLQYLQLINTSFMPNNYNYFEYITTRNDDDYITNRSIDQFIVNNFITSEIASKGDIKKASMMDVSSLRYRRVYAIGDITIRPNYYYTIEFFVPFTKSRNVLETLIDYVNNEKTSFLFLFNSMFQIDVFVRKNYARRSDENKYYYTISRIQKIFKDLNEGSTQKIYTEIFSHIDKRYFYSVFKSDNIKYVIPYRVDDKTWETLREKAGLNANEFRGSESRDQTYYDSQFYKMFQDFKVYHRIDSENTDFPQSQTSGFYIKPEGEDFPNILHMPKKNVTVNRNKASVRNMVNQIRKNEDELSDRIKKKLNQIDKKFLKVKTTIENNKVSQSIKDLFHQLIEEYGRYGDSNENS